jgi:uncharacterized membrane protein
MLRKISICLFLLAAQSATAASIVTEYSGPAGLNFVNVRDITRDGRCAVGDAFNATNSVALRWCDGMVTEIPVLTTDGLSNNAYAISDDGKTVAGASGSGFRGQPRMAFKWTEGGGTIALPGIDGQTRNSAFSITPDGRFIAGQSRPLGSGGIEFQAIRWDNETPTKLDTANQLRGETVQPGGISHDGKTIIGAGLDSLNVTRSFVWTEAAGITVLNLPAGYDTTSVSAISGNGNVIGGSLAQYRTYDAALWSSDGILSNIFNIEGYSTSIISLTETGSMALLGAYGNSVCTDTCTVPLPTSYFIYQSGLDLISFDSWFLNLGGTFPADWSAIVPTQFSDTGAFLIGTAQRGGGQLSWRADLRGSLVSIDEPQTAVMLLVALGLIIRRRRHSAVVA